MCLYGRKCRPDRLDSSPPVFSNLRWGTNMPAMVKCAECGLLSFRSRADGSFAEVDRGFRETGHFPIVEFDAFFEPHAVCCALSCDLVKEKDATNILDVMQKDRTCGSFKKWLPGHSPGDHLEILQLEREQEWQKQRDN